MKIIISFLVSVTILIGCSKPQISQTRSIGINSPWTDTSSLHPKNVAFKALLEKYRKKGLPGISLLVKDNSGTWIGATGKADISNEIDFVPGTISKAASITKLFVGTLVFKLMEDSVNTGIGYLALNKKIGDWLPSQITNKLANGNIVTFGQCLKHETGIPDLIEEDPFYLAVLNNPNKNGNLWNYWNFFVGTLVFKLMEDSVNTGIGYLALNKKIGDWLPSQITNKLANGNIVTFGQCLKHETGIPDLIEEDPFYLAVLNNPNKKWQPLELLEFIYDKSSLFSPGDTAIYSNTNTILVTMVIEAQTGKKHADLLKQYILNPLGLTQTFYQPHDQLPNSVAQGYFDLYNNNTIVNVSNFVTGSGNGYGGLYSNLFDLYKFADALLLKQILLKQSSWSLMQTYGKEDDDNRYGYGIQKSYLTRGINYGIGHKGRDLGYTANMFYYPNKGVLNIFFINYGTDADSGLKDVFREFSNELLDITLQ